MTTESQPKQRGLKKKPPITKQLQFEITSRRKRLVRSSHNILKTSPSKYARPPVASLKLAQLGWFFPSQGCGVPANRFPCDDASPKLSTRHQLPEALVSTSLACHSGSSVPGKIPFLESVFLADGLIPWILFRSACPSLWVAKLACPMWLTRYRAGGRSAMLKKEFRGKCALANPCVVK